MPYSALATDYDGTLAHDGHVDPETVDALRALIASGRKVVLVTGREVSELLHIFPEVSLCDVVVAENGGLLYWPNEGREEVFAEPPPEQFVLEMSRLDVKPFSVGRVVFATWRPHETTVLEAIQRLGMGHQIIFNKDAVMVLPPQVNKATGLSKALKRLGIAPECVVGIGDAENDYPFLDACGVAVAVENALEPLKSSCDLVVADHGRGVVQIIQRILEDDLASLGPRQPRNKLMPRAILH
jgi:hydroxymethylpyrimidine pyrophosphatase-like HAD family hydrolase